VNRTKRVVVKSFRQKEHEEHVQDGLCRSPSWFL
jgi:hypothetical protein